MSNSHKMLALLNKPTKSNLSQLLNRLIQPAAEFAEPTTSGLKLGTTSALCSESIAKMEGLSRLFWGIFPSIAGSSNQCDLSALIEAVKLGTDPSSSEYWGDIGAIDQRTVEAAVYGFGFCLVPDQIKDLFDQQSLDNLVTWLAQTANCEVADSNWRFFPIIIQVGLMRMGFEYDQSCLNRHFNGIEEMYLGNGWYCDGPGRPKDYYISMGFHFYSLLYVKFMTDKDPERCMILQKRAEQFSHDYITLFSPQGDTVPFGRSLTYRFAHVAYWSAMVYVESNEHSLGVMKGIILRNLRWWAKQDILNNHGLITIGYSYSNLVMAEDYNGPGSPYWALKTFLFLALEDQHPFWQCEEKPLPMIAEPRVIPQAAKIVFQQAQSNHTWFLTSGQLELNNYVNTDAKYTKFAYSNKYGFCLDRGRFGLRHTPIDSALYLSEKDGYFRSRRDCQQLEITSDYIYSRWAPWHDVTVDTWLLGEPNFQVRVHKITSQRELDSVEGGWALPLSQALDIHTTENLSHCRYQGGNLFIKAIAGNDTQGFFQQTPPNSHLLFSEQATIPALQSEISKGTNWLVSVIGSDCDRENLPDISFESHTQTLTWHQKHIQLNQPRKINN
ncbi:DUF2264 domain-containing protein [Photobacterium sp. ZSDE20]|uniref:DUF2264 domain-containing protein n=1 Tax=Photobacterium pectinilyticum TaxID=2906793 RepID=A0ABT1N8U1_9GAMM|nr:DUF2264 domain-containing protein [Photobacterium sp. ZSDE20]MCQ1061165.1 DUF2264 domain-containing protein [Photobacterium sp. ZSDE20]MDD1829376.1 DUF2264 domain-containing protein [Photobacterium sp. ZSDE20]